jgi:hypothetical protein
MAIELKSSSSLVWNAASPHTITAPTGIADGDLLIWIAVNSNSAMDVTTPDNWALVDRYSSSATNHTINVFRKIAASEGASFSLDDTEVASVMLRISGYEPGSMIIDYQGDEKTNTATPSFTSSAISPTTANSMIVFVGCTNVVGSPTNISNYAISVSNPAWTEAQEVGNGTYGRLGVATAIRAETSDTGNASFSNGGGATTDNSCFIMAVKRQVSFTTDPTETVTSSDSIENKIGRNVVITETVTETDSIDPNIGHWSSGTKHNAIVTNQPKS